MNERKFFLIVLFLLAQSCLYAQDIETAKNITDAFEPSTRKEKKQEEIIADNGEDNSVKRNEIIKLVEKAIAYFKKTDTMKALSAFIHSAEFVYGDYYIFAYTADGICLANSRDQSHIWKNLLSMSNVYGITHIKNLIDQALSGGGWTTYDSRNSIKVSYTQKVEKDGVIYIIGCGYYPYSKEYTAEYLVNNAVKMFDELQSKKRHVSEFFSFLNYTNSTFVVGDLFPWVIDRNGTTLANAGRPGLVGLNYLAYLTSTQGENVSEAFISNIEEKLRQTLKKGVWVSYFYDTALKKTYVSEVKDLKERKYFIGCGYYPLVSKEVVVDLVRKGIKKVETVGDEIAFKEFSDRRNSEFRYGDLYLIAYDLKGVCHANGENPEFVGQNFFDAKDDHGRYYVRKAILRGRADGGWIQFREKNAFKMMYASEVIVGSPERHYIICCGLYPLSQSDLASLLVKSAVSYLRTYTEDRAFEAFADRNGQFIVGDLDITVFDEKGFCYVASDEKELIWQNLLDIQDDNGKKYVKMMIDSAQKGSTAIDYQINGAKKIAYIEKVEKKDKVFFVVSSYTDN